MKGSVIAPVFPEKIPQIHSGLMVKIAGHKSESIKFDFMLYINKLDKELYIFGPRKGIKLAPMEYQLIWLLTRAGGSLVTHDEIYYFLYQDYESDLPLNNTVEVFISRLRKHLDEIGSSFSLVSRNRLGWELSTQRL